MNSSRPIPTTWRIVSGTGRIVRTFSNLADAQRSLALSQNYGRGRDNWSIVAYVPRTADMRRAPKTTKRPDTWNDAPAPSLRERRYLREIKLDVARMNGDAALDKMRQLGTALIATGGQVDVASFVQSIVYSARRAAQFARAAGVGK